VCYNTVWLLIEITDQGEDATSAEEGLMAVEAKIGRCLRQPAATAARNVKCHLSQLGVNLFIAEIALEP